MNGANGPVVLFRGRLSDARWAREHWPLMRGKERLSFGMLETNISHTNERDERKVMRSVLAPK